MSNHVAIEPLTGGQGLVIENKGMEQCTVYAPGQQAFVDFPAGKAFVPSNERFYFHTIEQARDFCRMCDFTWSVRCK